VLSLTTLGAFSKLLGTVEKEFGPAMAAWFTMVSASQYHFMYYISRPLPNIMALPLGTKLTLLIFPLLDFFTFQCFSLTTSGLEINTGNLFTLLRQL